MKLGLAFFCFSLIASGAIPAFAGEKTLQDWIAEADALEKAGKVDEAAAALKALVLEVETDQPLPFKDRMALMVWASYFYKKQNRSVDFVSLLREAEKKRPDDEIVTYFLALTLEPLGKIEEGIAVWKALVMKLTADSPLNSWSVMKEAVSFFKKHDRFEELEALLREAKNRRPGDRVVAFYVASILEKAGKVEEAIAAWKALVMDVPADRPLLCREVMVGASNCLEKENRFEELETLFREAKKKKPGDEAAAAFHASTLENRTKFDEAAVVYRAIGEGGGSYAPWAWLKLGHHLFYRKKRQDIESARAYLNAVKGNPADKTAADMANHIARLLEDRRVFDDARFIWEEMTALRALEPLIRAGYHLSIAFLDLQFGHLDAAESRVREAMALAPMDAEMVNNLGLVHIAAGRDRKAVKAFEESLTLDPEYADALENLGIYYWKRGRPGKAKGYFLRCHPIAYRGAGRARRAVEEARAAVKKGELLPLERSLKLARFRLYRIENYLRQLAKPR